MRILNPCIRAFQNRYAGSTSGLFAGHQSKQFFAGVQQNLAFAIEICGNKCAVPMKSTFLAFTREVESALGRFDYSAYKDLEDQPRQAKQYIFANPLVAIQMTRHDVRAALYAPLRMLVYADLQNKVVVEYDLPSSLFGQFGNAEATQVARELDSKVTKLLEAVDSRALKSPAPSAQP